MLERIRNRGVSISLSPDGSMGTSGPMTAIQRKYLDDHRAELVALLWAEDGATTCVRCEAVFDCHQEGRYAEYAKGPDGEPGILCGACSQYVDNVMGRYEKGEDVAVRTQERA